MKLPVGEKLHIHRLSATVSVIVRIFLQMRPSLSVLFLTMVEFSFLLFNSDRILIRTTVLYDLIRNHYFHNTGTVSREEPVVSTGKYYQSKIAMMYSACVG